VQVIAVIRLFRNPNTCNIGRQTGEKALDNTRLLFEIELKLQHHAFRESTESVAKNMFNNTAVPMSRIINHFCAL